MDMRSFLLTLFTALLLAAAPALAQHEGHAGHQPAEPTTTQEPPEGHAGHEEHGDAPAAESQDPEGHAGHGEHGETGMAPADPVQHEGHAGHEMPAMYGPYAMSRESSGTSWQPDSAPHQGVHFSRGAWDLMVHGQATLVYDDQDGPRGDTDLFSSNMLMAMGTRPAGPGRFSFRGMVSAEPWTIGDEGYPLLLQTGETADGVTPLVDAQHPHDLFMELAAAYSLPVADDASVFLYLGLPGEPALGPPAFPHRFAAMENPAAPLSHHWLDSTHITFGVATLGWVRDSVKLEGSIFTGREPDEKRENIESPKMDSWSVRASWQPAPSWSLQASYGQLESPEQLEPGVDTDRLTASAIHSRPLAGGTWQTVLAWGRNAKDPGETTDALLLESALARGRHTLFGRVERVENDELGGHGDDHGHEAAQAKNGEHEEEGGVHGEVFNVGELTLGYLYDVWQAGALELGAGGLGTLSLVPAELEAEYGDSPLSFMAFLRLRL